MPREIARRGADLARRASKLLADDATGVGFSVSHWVDAKWLFSDILADATEHRDSEWDTPVQGWSETLTSAAWGHAVVALASRITTTPGDHWDWVRRVEIDKELAVPEPGRDGYLFYGRARPNPLLLYEGVQEVEMSLRLPAEQAEPTFGDARVLSLLINKVAETAAEAQAPLSFVQAPASEVRANQVTCDAAVQEEERAAGWRQAITWSLRFAIGLRPADATKRFEVQSSIVRLARKYGLGLWLGDRRGDSRLGHWLQICEPDRVVYNERLDEFGTDGRRPLPDYAVPVTFVGPAREGTTKQVMDALRVAELQVVSASVGVLKNLAFISVLIPHAEADQDSDRKILNLTSRLNSSASKTRLPPGYRSCEGPCTRIQVRSSRETFAAWAGWRMADRPAALDDLVSGLKVALETVRGDISAGQADLDDTQHDIAIEDVNIDYMVCRRFESGYLSGRAKLSVPKSFVRQGDMDRPVEEWGRLCRRVVAEWQRELRKRVDSRPVEVEFSWQETRLGRWHTLVPGIPS